MARGTSVDLAQLVDIIGLRILCESVEAATDISQELGLLASHKKTLDYVAKPRDTGYRGRHCIVKVEQSWPGLEESAQFEAEIQVRTWLQHLWALVSEQHGEQVKEGGGPRAVREYLLELSQCIAGWEEANPGQSQVAFASDQGGQHIVVARRPFKGGAPYLESFRDDYSGAMRRLLAWEDDLGASDYDSLLLVGIGNPKYLGSTHSVFFGAGKIPLPEWAPTISQLDQ